MQSWISRVRLPAGLAAVLLLALAPRIGAQERYSHGAGMTGIAILQELLLGQGRFIVGVDSNGCTDKGSFKVEVKKTEGTSPRTPHYLLTLVRIKADECKAIVDGGVLISFDLEKDLGVAGIFTYSLTNPVVTMTGMEPLDESMLAAIGKK